MTQRKFHVATYTVVAFATDESDLKPTFEGYRFGTAVSEGGLLGLSVIRTDKTELSGEAAAKLLASMGYDPDVYDLSPDGEDLV